jgi:hypothetical protein
VKRGKHFAKFRALHRQGMALAQVGTPQLTQPNGNGMSHDMQETVHLPDKLPFWMRVRMYFQKGWEPVTVNKQVDSVTMPKWIASAILVAILGFGVTSWIRSSDQRDMLIELKTELRLAKEYDAERARQLKDQADLNKVYIDNVTAQLNTIKGMLSQQQINAAERRGN